MTSVLLNGDFRRIVTQAYYSYNACPLFYYIFSFTHWSQNLEVILGIPMLDRQIHCTFFKVKCFVF